MNRHQRTGSTAGRRGHVRPLRPVFNPATGEQAGEVDFASVAEVDAAVAAARRRSRRGGRRRWRAGPR